MTTKKDDQKKTCQNPAAYRFTWAGQDESFICFGHADHLRLVAQAIRYHVQLIPIEQSKGEKCRQILS